VHQWQVSGNEREYGRSCEQDPPHSQHSSQINGERSDEHQRNIEGTSDPGTLIVADSKAALQISKTKRQ
jgi:hypothetical protein